MCDFLSRDGGVVCFGQEVVALAPEGRRWRLTFRDGSELEATRVVANVPPAAVDRLRGRAPRLPAEHDAWGAFVLHLGIDASGLAQVHPFHQVLGAESRQGSAFVSVFPSRSRPAAWSISVSRHVRPSAWRGHPCDAEERRSQLEQDMLGDVARVIPDVRQRVRLLRSATPATFERYTARPGGFVGGIVQRPSVVALRAPGHRPEAGLFMAGDHVFPGQGTVGTALSGINAYRDVVESLGREPLL